MGDIQGQMEDKTAIKYSPQYIRSHSDDVIV